MVIFENANANENCREILFYREPSFTQPRVTFKVNASRQGFRKDLNVF
jgi:hypothetical protein